MDTGPPIRVRARTHFRDFDAITRQVTRFGPSKASAERALKLALRDRSAPGQSEIIAETRVALLGKRWLEDLPADRSTNSRQTYAYVLNNYVLPGLGARRVREVRTPTVDRLLKAIGTNAGLGAAKSARSVLSGMFRLAARYGVVTVNPVREAAPVTPAKKTRIRSLTRDEADEMTDLLCTHQRALDLDLPDLVDFMLGTGVRIGEASAVRHGTDPDGEPLLDIDHAAVEINPPSSGSKPKA